MAYTPPIGSAADIILGAAAYTPPLGSAADIILGDDNAIGGAGVINEAADTLSATGVAVPIATGDASITEGADTLSATGSVLVQGTANITEVADTLTGTGSAAVPLVLLASNVALTFTRNAFKTAFAAPIAAPYVYVDSASALGALSAFPLSTVVTLGQKFAVTGSGTNYWECSQAGTSAGSEPTTDLTQMGVEFISNTAKFRSRKFHGWARASTKISINSFNQTAVTAPSLINPETIIVASSHAQTLAATLSLPMVPNFAASGTIPGHTLISADKSVAIPVTATAGASVLGTGDSKGLQPTGGTLNLGLIRGMTLGHDNSASTLAGKFDVFDWSTGVRFYDCVFQSFRLRNASTTFEYAHSGARHSMRCNYKSMHATDPEPALGLNGLSVMEVPTITRLVSSTTPVVTNTSSSSNDLLLLGADLSTFTGGLAFDTTGGGTASGAFRAFGTKFASGALVQPATHAVEVEFAALGATVVGEHLSPVKVPSAQSGSAVSRELTIIRTGGASDALGSYSYKATITNGLQYPYTFEFWNQKIDESFLLTLDFQWSSTGTGLTALTAEDVWLEAAYFNNPGVPNTADYVFSFDKYNRRGLIYNDSVGPSLLTVSGATWGGGLASPVKQKVSIILTPKKIGRIKVWVGAWLCPWTQNIASVSTMPIYFDPLPVLSAAP